LYPAALQTLEQYAQVQFGRPLLQLASAEVIDVLSGLEAGSLAGFPPAHNGIPLDQKTLFKTFFRHCIQGCFADPRWGGNVREICWRSYGYQRPAEDVYPGE
jgi:hypothetical protein